MRGSRNLFASVRLANAVDRIAPERGSSDFSVGLESVEPWTGSLTRNPNLGVQEEANKFSVNDILFGKLRPYLAKTWVAERNGCYIGDFIRLRARESFSAEFLGYILRSKGFVDRATAESTGSKMPRTEWDRLREILIPAPPTERQRLIVEYLNHETAEIDVMVEEQKNVCARLEERRISLMDRLIGSSGIRTPLKYALTYQEGPGIMANDFRDEGVPLLRIAGVHGSSATLEGCNYLSPEKVHRHWEHFRVKRGDLLITASASMGTVSVVDSEDVIGAVPYTGIIRIKPGDMIQNYARWFFLSPEFMRQVNALRTGSTMQHFGPSHLSQMSAFLPSFHEQKLISDLLDEKQAQGDELIVDAEKVIELLLERRAALISAAVTGQIDVTAKHKPVAEQLEDELAEAR